MRGISRDADRAILPPKQRDRVGSGDTAFAHRQRPGARVQKMSQRRANTPAGFQGSVGNLPLVDLLQVWAMNRLSGLVTVNSQSRTGHLYFADGAIVHAEADELAGEAAVGAILGWPEGTFELAPNTTTLKRTIQKSLSHLLLDAHRVMDERQRDVGAAAVRPASPPAPPAPPARDPSRPAVLDQIRAIRGVARVVRFAKDSRPIGEAGPEAEALAAKGVYLAMTHAACVAATFGLHDLGLATVHGDVETFVLVHGSASSLCVALDCGVAVDPVVAQLRALLTRPAPR
jgi:hypothetical protein